MKANTLKAVVGISVIIFTFLTVVPSWINAQEKNEVDMPAQANYLDLPLQTITGDTTSLSQFRGKVVLIVNTASKCGFTPQYEGLEALYDKYKDQGFTVIGFPANDFLRQEPGSNEEIATFCKVQYGVSFPMMAKIHVKGKEQHPLYAYLTSSSSFPGKITWNFNKFLLDREGNVIARFDSRTKPEDDKMAAAIRKALKEKDSM